MGLFTRAFAPRASIPFASGVVQHAPTFGSAPPAYPSATVRAFTTNEIVSAGINLLATSAAEPQIIGRRWRQNRPQIRNEMRQLAAVGLTNGPGRKAIDAAMVRNGFWEEVDGHPLVKLLNHPNPYTSRGQFWAQIVVDYYLSGNAYILKARYKEGLLGGAVGELWRLRPDRVKPVPGDMMAGEQFVRAYEYTAGATKPITVPASDIMHFKTRSALDPYSGVSPLVSVLDRLAVDQNMRTFLRTFYERGGAGVGAVLNFKGSSKMEQEQKDDIRSRFERMFRGGQYGVLVSTADDVQYTPFGLDRGLRDALPKEIDALIEARVAMVLGIPGSILGLLIGYESSSYANKRQDWQVFWDITMAPLLSDFDDVLNLSLVPEFGGVDEVLFDLSDIRALQEDVDLLQDRARKNVAARVWTMEEGRQRTGVGDLLAADHFIMPDGSLIKVGEIDSEQGVPAGDVQTFALNGAQIASLLTVIQEVTAKTLAPETAKAILKVSFPSLGDDEIAELIDTAASFEPSGDIAAGQNRLVARVASMIAAPAEPMRLTVGRPRLDDDPAARAIYEEALVLKERYPNLTWGQVSARVGIDERTLRKYRTRFDP